MWAYELRISACGSDVCSSDLAVTGGTRAGVAIVTARDGDEMILAVAELADVERRPIESFDNSRRAADLVFAETQAIELLRGSVAEAAAVHILAMKARRSFVSGKRVAISVELGCRRSLQ